MSHTAPECPECATPLGDTVWVDIDVEGPKFCSLECLLSAGKTP
jgi:hypothetical protein